MDPAKDNESAISSDLIRGHINTIILRTLYDGDKYGYEIINEIEEKSKGQYSLKQPTLYSALKRLESQDFVTSYWGGVSNGGRRKYFQITDKGKQVVEQNLAEWEYSRTVIDSLISEKDYDFNNPPPSAVDFSLLKKSTTRITSAAEPDHDDIVLGADTYDDDDILVDAGENSEHSENRTQEDILSPADTEERATQEEESVSETRSEATPANDERTSYTEESRIQTVVNNYDSGETASPQRNENSESSYTYTERTEETVVHDPVIDEEQRRIQHENYRNLVGNEDATSYYYAQVARNNRSDQAPEPQQPAAQQAASEVQADKPFDSGSQAYQPQQPAQSETDETYLENRAISSELLYSNRSPAERNYKDLLSRLYDNTRREQEENELFADPVPEYAPGPEPEPPVQQSVIQEQTTEEVRQENIAAQRSTQYADASTASNVEFYDIEERAESDGIRVTTSNGARNRAVSGKPSGNVFDKGKALFMSALYVFVIALVECIINLCIKNAIHSHPAYVVLPFALTFVMFGIFLFLYLKGYGKNSRKTQSRSYISASLILFANLVIIVCLIAYFIISAGNGITFVQVLKYAILPCIFIFNIPLFAIFYNYHSNRQ